MFSTSTKATIQNFQFKHIEIYKGEENLIGIGSYGAVYKAKCDDLTCAAKILHPVLFQSNDPGARKILQRFEQECDFMNYIKHPNIVLFLGVCRDLDSYLPVLLMELLDESLTRFLERSTRQLLFHTQLDICYDVTLALSYLHANEIIHRDLSSNNVLIVAASRAKLSDFGMSKLMGGANPDTHSARTFCPGTEVYMSPEAMKKPPVYTEKLDCFSFGVLLIQVLTCLFPNPGPRTREIACLDSPTGKIDMPVLETERRNNHIRLVDSAHPMLSIAIGCLNYNHNERPTSSDLCKFLSAILTTSEYTNSKEISRARDKLITVQQLQRQKSSVALDPTIAEKQLVEQKKLLFNKEHKSVLKENDGDLLGFDKQTDMNQLLLKKDKDLSLKEHELVELQNELDEEQTNQLDKNQPVSNQLEEAQESMCEKDIIISQQKSDVSELQQRLHETERDLQYARQMLVKRETEIIDQHPRNIKEPPQIPCHTERISQPEYPVATDSFDNSALVQMVSTRKGKAVCKMARGSTAVNGSMIYFRAAGGSEVYLYDIEQSCWSELPQCPLSGFTLVMVDGILTSIGVNESDSRGVNILLCYSPSSTSGGEWFERFPVMFTKRYNPAAVYSEQILVVAGGNVESGEKSMAVEVMDTTNQKWFVTSELPIPISQASAVVCKNSVYLIGGVDNDRKWVNLVQTCTIDDLRGRFSKKQSLNKSKGRLSFPRSHQKKKVSEWHLIANLPVCRATCTFINNTLLAVGGVSFSKGTTSRLLYMYNADGDFWEIGGQMAISRSQCLVASQGNKVVVVGGWVSGNDMTDDIEVLEWK